MIKESIFPALVGFTITLGALALSAVTLKFVRAEPVKTIYTGPGIDISVINSECKARNAGESVWIDCDVFFGDKRLTKTR